MEELEGVNASLVADIHMTLDQVTGDMGRLNSSIVGELASLLAALRSDGNALEEWLTTVTDQLDDRAVLILDQLASFEASTGEDLMKINETLEDLERLETILAGLEALEGELEQAKTELSQDVEESGDDLDSAIYDANRSGMAATELNRLLIIVVLVLTIVICLLTLRLWMEVRSD